MQYEPTETRIEPGIKQAIDGNLYHLPGAIIVSGYRRTDTPTVRVGDRVTAPRFGYTGIVTKIRGTRVLFGGYDCDITQIDKSCLLPLRR